MSRVFFFFFLEKKTRIVDINRIHFIVITNIFLFDYRRRKKRQRRTIWIGLFDRSVRSYFFLFFVVVVPIVWIENENNGKRHSTTTRNIIPDVC